MEKRFLTFIVASLLTLLVFSSLNRMLFPPQEQPVQEEVAQDVDDSKEADASDVEKATNTDTASEETSTDRDVSESDVQAEIAAEISPSAQALQRGTLGSLNRESGFEMLVTWTNEGAAIERVELNNPKYTSIEEKYGYLGNLALEDTPQGCLVNVVGPGTPASLAKSSEGRHVGLQPGDLLTRIDGQPVNNQREVQLLLERTTPGQIVPVSVKRETAEATEEIEFNVALTKHPLEVIRPEPEIPNELEPRHPLSYLMEISQIGSRTIALGEETIKGLPRLSEQLWTVETSQDGNRHIVEFRYVVGAKILEAIGYDGTLTLIKRFTLSPSEGDSRIDGYDLNLDVEIINETGQQLELAYRLDGATGLPYEGWWYAYKVHPTKFSGAGIRDIVYRFDGTHQMMPNSTIVKQTKKNPDTPFVSLLDVPKPLRYIGVDAQYFASTIVPAPVMQAVESDGDPADALENSYKYQTAICRAVAGISQERSNKTDVSFRLDSVAAMVPQSGKLSHSFTVFAGPKKPDVLAHYGLEECISYGWFAAIAKLLTSILHFFYGIVGNYGISIVLLTVLVRGSLLWFGRQQALNAARMQELAPEMKKIAEKYKDDLQKRSEAQRELFRKNNYNPLSGCLPMFFQLPIFVGLYRALSVDIELRQAPLIPGIDWCSNLAAPDQLFRWDSFMPSFLAGTTGFLGPYFNILPICSVALMIVHQKLFSPPPADEQQEMQMKMMKYMMVFFGFMFFRVPAGLCLYFITSSLWAIGERKLLPKPKPKNTVKTGETAATKEPTVQKKHKQNSLIAKITAAVEQKQERANGAARKKEREQQRKKKRKQN